MQKIRIKKAPKPGDQQDYSLVGRNVSFTDSGKGTSNVKNTMSATSEEEANIEVEGGETVVGDINKDGFLEQFTFVGKRHSKGGMPVNIPEGSFIFSDTKKLKIKDKEILESIFGLKEKKGGYTPAEIAKKYQINQFVQDLKSEDTDAIQKRSSAEMLKKNTQKLGMLALVQESMKGFPDGIPAIAESVMAGLQGAQVPGMEQGEGVAHEVMEGQEEGMKCGGSMKRKYPDGGPIKYTPNTVIYLNGVPFRYVKHEDNWGWGTGDKVSFKADDGSGRTYDVNSEKLGEILNKSAEGKYAETGIAGDKYKRYYVGTTPQNSPDYYSKNTISKIAGQSFKPGDTFYAKGQQYKVVDANAAFRGYNVSSGVSPTTGIPSGGGGAYNAPSVKVQKIDNTGKPVGGNFVLDPLVISNAVATNTFDYTGKTQQTPNSTNVGTFGNPAPVAAPQQTTVKQTPVETQQATQNAPRQNVPTQQPKPTGKPKTAQDALNYFASGGSVYDSYQVGAQVNNGTLNTTVATQQDAQNASTKRVDPNQEVFAGNITLENGTVLKAYYKGNQKYVKDANGAIVAQGTRTDVQNEQYGSQNINQIISKAQNVKYTNTNFGTFANQPNVKGTGIYLSSGNAAARTSGDLSPEEWADFQDRHGDWINKEYAGGFEQLKKDLKSGRETGDKAAGWFQDTINEKSMKQFGVPYFAPLGSNKETNPYFRDSKFGQVTYSVPRFFDNAEKPTEPVKDTPETPTTNVPETPSEKQPKKDGPWWLQDIVNYVGTATDQVNRYEPTQGKIDLVTPGYDLLDPTRKLAANQEQMARYQNQVQNTADGNVGLATTLGASGEGFANAANVLDTTESANIGIVNQAYNTNAQVQNQEILGNENARQKYVEDMATLNQQYDNSLQQKKWREIAAFNNGTSNWFRKKQMENVLFPQVYTDPIMGDVEFSGEGRQIFGDEGTAMAPQTYASSYMNNNQASNMGAGMTNNYGLDTWQNIYEQALPVMGETAARNWATKRADNQIQMQNKMSTQFAPTQRQQYNQMVQQGLTLPAPLREFGGAIYLPWSESE